MNVTDKIRTLSKKEIAVLFWICMGLTNREIIEELSLNDKTLGSRITRIYLKLEIEGNDKEKRDLLLTGYCKTVKELVDEKTLKNWIPQKPPAEEETKYAIIEYRYPDPPDEPTEEPEERQKELPGQKGGETIHFIDKKALNKTRLIAGGIIGVLLLVIVFLVLRPPPQTLPNSSTQTPENTPISGLAPQKTSTGSPMDTPIPSIPAKSSENGLFQDDFKGPNGLADGWVVESGEPLITNGSLSVLGQTPLVLSVGDVSWKNYDIQISFTRFCDFSLGVRAQDKNNMVALSPNRPGRLSWSTLINGVSQFVGDESLYQGDPPLLEVIVDGNHFNWVGHVDLVLTGHDQGRVFLGLGCAAIKDFKITALP